MTYLVIEIIKETEKAFFVKTEGHKIWLPKLLVGTPFTEKMEVSGEVTFIELKAEWLLEAKSRDLSNFLGRQVIIWGISEQAFEDNYKPNFK